MDATLHKFPVPGGGKRAQVRPPPVFETFSPERTNELLEVAQGAIATAQILLDFVHDNRDVAHQAGIETIAIEMASIIQGERWNGLVDALEEAVQSGRPLELTRDGLSILRRMEALIAESSMNMRKFTEGDFTVMELVEIRARRDADAQRAYLEMEERRISGIRNELASKESHAHRQSQTISALRASLGFTSASKLGQSKPNTAEIPIWIPFAIFGAIIATVTVIAVVAAKK